MENTISPKYQMNLIKQLDKAIWDQYKSYKEVTFYIKKWHKTEYTWNSDWENFSIIIKESGDIDLLSTLNNIDGTTLLQMAVDLGVETPDFIPSIAIFRNEIKSDYSTASATFEKAFKQIETHPDIAIGLANSALESIIKEIFKDDRISTRPKEGKTLYDLTSHLLKELYLFPGSDMPEELKIIGSSLLSANQGIEKLRSTKTVFHGKTSDDYFIDDSMYAYFIVNTVTTVGLFLKSYYVKKFPKVDVTQQNNSWTDELPF